MELWGNDVAFRGAVSPVFYTGQGTCGVAKRLPRVPPESHRQCAASDAVTVICSDLG